ncbi:MAG: phospho-sugar mutase [Flavobacteriales bacterium]
MNELEQKVRERAVTWTRAPFDEVTRMEVEAMMAAGGDELIEAFYTDLEFGTGGLRGIMGHGTNRMNAYTVAMATQGLANYILDTQVESPSVAIAHDSRNRSPEFARVAAEVLAGNGIRAHLFQELRPTPELSFAVRHLGCTAGIVLTASHNPKEYNGYKVYWSDGGQIVPPHDAGIIAKVREVTGPSDVRRAAADSSWIETISDSVDEAYRDVLRSYRLHEGLVNQGSDLPIVYTPLHGTGAVSVVPALAANGFRNVQVVESQAQPDGDFPTVHSPNPEEGAALEAAIALGRETQSALVMGTDPDSDRVGIAVPDGLEWRLLNGNETGALLVDYVVKATRMSGRLEQGDYLAKTVVTSDLISALGREAGLPVHETLTGFKWIADVIRRREEEPGSFLVGGEESYGYLIGEAVRDKDAVAAACLIAECAHAASEEGKSLLDKLRDIHERHGVWQESLVSLKKEGRQGKAQIADMMDAFRNDTPQELAGEKVVEFRDYRAGEMRNMVTGGVSPIGLPLSNVVSFRTELGSLVTARPSGTEPKIKFYFSVHSTSEAAREDYEGTRQQLLNRIEALKEAVL